MSENKSARDKESYPLDVLQRHLDTPQLLPHEMRRNSSSCLTASRNMANLRPPATIWGCIRPRC
jgi:hypothetical protein